MKEKPAAIEVVDSKQILKEDLHGMALEIEGELFSFPGISDDGLRIMREYEEDPDFEMSGARAIDDVLKDCMDHRIRIVPLKSGIFAVPANCSMDERSEDSSTISLRHLHVTANMDQNMAALIHNAKKK